MSVDFFTHKSAKFMNGFFSLFLVRKLVWLVHLFIRTLLQLKPKMDMVVHVAVALYSQPNNNWPKDQCGTNCASIALSVIVLLIQCALAMAPTKKFTVAPVTVNCSDQKASDTATPQPCPPTANLLLIK